MAANAIGQPAARKRTEGGCRSLADPRCPVVGAASALALTVATGYRARHVSPYRPVLERLALSLPNAHASLAGLRIGFMTDTHVGPFVSPHDVARAASLLTAERPEIVLFGGDFVADSPRYASAAARALGPLAAAPLGAFAVLGNHDVANGATKVASSLQAVGIRVLRNESVGIETGTGRLWIAGVDDAILGAHDPDATVAEVPPGDPILALWHEPDWATQTAALGAFCQLSGHSHGGQVRLPGVPPFAAPAGGRRYPVGLSDASGMPVYTSRGVGVYRPPIRLNCPPEVTIITLVQPSPRQ